MKASTMFNRLPGAMLSERHMHECKQGRNCGRALLHDTAGLAQSHRLFNPAPPEAGLSADRWRQSRTVPQTAISSLAGTVAQAFVPVLPVGTAINEGSSAAGSEVRCGYLG